MSNPHALTRSLKYGDRYVTADPSAKKLFVERVWRRRQQDVLLIGRRICFENSFLGRQYAVAHAQAMLSALPAPPAEAKD